MRLVRIWGGWSLYPQSFINSLASIFAGEQPKNEENNNNNNSQTNNNTMSENNGIDEDIDGVPL